MTGSSPGLNLRINPAGCLSPGGRKFQSNWPFGPVTRAAQAKANDPNGQLLWNFLPPGLRQPAGFIRRFEPGEEPVIFTQPSAFAQISRTTLMQAKDAQNPTPQQQRQQHVTAETSIGHGQVAVPELVEQSLEQPQFVLM